MRWCLSHRADPEAVAFEYPHNNRLACSALRFALSITGVLVLLFSSHERLIGFHNPGQRTVEGPGQGGLAEPMQNEPCRFLGDLEVSGERSAGDALFVGSEHPYREKPFAERYFGILEYGANLDGKTLAALTAFEGAPVGKFIYPIATAVWAERPIFPPD